MSLHMALDSIAAPFIPTPTPFEYVVCICGSTRFRDAITRADRDLTLAGWIVLGPGVFGHSGDPLTDAQKVDLDVLHLRKILMSAAVYVVNEGGYIGESTRREIEYATRVGKRIVYAWDAS